MSEIKWTKADKVLFGIVYGTMALAIVMWGIAELIEACRSTPKVQVFAFGIKKPSGKTEGGTSSAAE